MRSSPSPLFPSRPALSPRHSPLLPSATVHIPEKAPVPVQDSPRLCGLPLKYLALLTLAVQNAALSIVMHYSRISIPPSAAYSPAAAVLLNELLKGSISFVIAVARARDRDPQEPRHRRPPVPFCHLLASVAADIFSPDCWKLSIPAILYVIQNSLQFVAISNLPVASFQVAYQMKILTTAAFSVALLRKKLSSTKWLALLFLAIGVGIVQIQTTSDSARPHKNAPVGSAHDFHDYHVMSPMKGFAAVTAACFTSGLAGVYFEMVLKNSKADLWVRNVQLSLFSLIPALVPILYYPSRPHSPNAYFFPDIFRNFGLWAWATVSIQVFGGLVTAIVIKYSDNILKGFATSLSIVIAFLASVILFDHHITPSFLIGASTVLSATWMYNQPTPNTAVSPNSTSSSSSNGKLPLAPASPDEPILGQFSKGSTFGRKKPTVITTALVPPLTGPPEYTAEADGPPSNSGFGDTLDTTRYQFAPYGSPYASNTPSRVPSRSSTPMPPPSPRIPTGP